MGKLLRVGLVVALGVLAWGCGDDTTSTGSCGPANCAGCCTKNGNCIKPNQITANYCGSGGEMCSTCPSGQKCNTAGQCIKEACNAASCPGCCQGDQCLTGDSDAACGTGAAPCVACGTNQSCSAGKCASKGCDPTSCANGCCYNGVCFPGTNPSLCGKGGGACQACSGTQQCVNQACGTGGVCDANTCKNGCCLNGVCQAGTAINACGKGGAACQVCPSGSQCVSQACTGVACGPTTCASGCCDKNVPPNCVGGTSAPLCGKGGVACATCASGQACQNQACTNVTTTCSPLTCPSGCCDKTGQCQPGNVATACGKGGAPCTSCGTGQACPSQKCTCTPQSCPTGCCSGDTCRAGTESAACGKSGGPCAACTGTQKCLNQSCQSDCSTYTCYGCCDAQKVCHDPPNDSNCGYLGVPCTQCTSPSTCDGWGGVCNDTSKCSYTNCSSGCCKNNQCQPGTQDAACGEDGDGCEVCGGTLVPHLYCGTDPNTLTRECIATPASTWDVMLDSAEVKAGVDWDDFIEGSDPPEIRVKFTVAGQSGQSSAAAEGYIASWNNALLLTAKASDLTKAVHFELWDADTFGDEEIAKCDDWIYPRELKLGKTELTTCGGQPNNTNFIRIIFRYKVKAP